MPVYIGWRNPDVFTTRRWFGSGSRIVPVVQPSQPRMRKDMTGGHGASFFRLAFPSLVRDVCGPRGSNEYIQRAGVSGGVRQLR